jgi:hypothetical protein
MYARLVPLLGNDLVFDHEFIQVFAVNPHKRTLPIELNIGDCSARKHCPEGP